ncbi:MAG: site-specific integrase [Lachnospiraceae bacterium]|nr:site-specific integrase [Lachnospiraceae bacterium]
MPAYKNQERGTWYVSFHYTDWDGKNRRKKKEGFKTRREALEFENEFKRKQGGGTDMSFGSLVELYMEDCKTRLRESTVANKQWLFDSKVLPTFKDIPVRDITPAMIRRWQNNLMNDPEGYSQTYLKTINNQLSACFNFAVRFYGLAKNPVVQCGPFGKGRAEEMQFWTRDEFYQFIEAVDKPAARLAFEILFWSGIRSGELLALTLDDVDFAKSSIRISKTVASVNGKTVISPPKTPKGNRTVVIPRFILALIRGYADRLVDYEPHEQLFYFTKHFLRYEMDKGCEKSGVKRIRVHDLRHSHASMLIEMGYSPLLISERLGHENIQTTLQTHSHLYPDKQQEVASQMEESEAEKYADILSAFEKKEPLEK